MEYQKKSLLPGIICVFLCALLLFAAVGCVVVALSDAQQGELPFFLGRGICASNGAYEGVDKNAMVLAKRADAAQLEAGDVVVFYYEEAPTTAKLYLANILEVREDGTLSVYLGQQYGDMRIDPALVRGEAASYIGGVGFVVSLMEGRYGILLSMALCVLLLAILILTVSNLLGIRAENNAFAALAAAKDGVDAIQQEAEEPEAAAEPEQEAEPEAEKKQEAEEEPEEQPAKKLGWLFKHKQKKEAEAAEAEIEEAAEEAEEIPAREEEAQPEELSAAAEVPAAEEEAQPEVTQPSHSIAAAMEVLAEMAEAPAEQAEEQEAPAEETEENAEEAEQIAEAEQTEQEAPQMPQDLKSSYLKGSFGTDRVGMEIACGEREAEVMKKLIDLTAKKRNRFGLFTSVASEEGEYVLKVWCEWEDVPAISSIVTEVKKRTQQHAKKG